MSSRAKIGGIVIFERVWKSDSDCGARHVIGNGTMLFYGIGPNIELAYGCCYSSPPFFQMDIIGDLSCVSRREVGTAIWEHKITHNGSCLFTDVMHPERDLFIRRFNNTSNAGISFRIKPKEQIKGIFRREWLKRSEGNLAAAILIYTSGPVFLPYDPVNEDLHMVASVIGNGHIQMDGDSFLITAEPGHSIFAFCSGEVLPDIVNILEGISLHDDEAECSARSFWNAYTKRRYPFEKMIRHSAVWRDKMLQVIDSVAVLLKCSQSKNGGVVPGHWYSAMGYMRDMSGVLRGFLTLGHIEEARAILDFWKNSFYKYGRLHNAEGLGPDRVRLMAGNNEVEIPAYLVLNCFFYQRSTGDDGLIKEMSEVLAWAMDVQIPHLVSGMTEFSFDETYIAGGIFPSQLIFQGSAESTLLFITGGRQLLEWAHSRNIFTEDQLRRWAKAVEEAQSLYRDNFVKDGLLFANNPIREKLASPPRFMTGFCASHTKLVNKWLEPDGNGNYICEECLAQGLTAPLKDIDHEKLYFLNSVSLLPIYLNAPFFSEDEKAAMAAPGIKLFKETGRVPSDIKGQRSLGYDYGLMLYTLAALNSPLKDAMLKKIIELLDPCCLWSEYYDDDTPAGCRARPWESAVNIAALIEYIKTKEDYAANIVDMKKEGKIRV